LANLLESLGLPLAYGEFIETTPLPYLIYKFAYSSDLMADNRNYVKRSNYQIELYTSKKDPALEELLEALLNANRLPYSKSEQELGTESMCQVIYSVQLIGG